MPMIGCECAVCRSDDPRDARTRPSVYVTLPDGTAILIDTAPDFRMQALRHRLPRVDAVLYTHGHADHVLGLDDLRRYNHLQREPHPVLRRCPDDGRVAPDVRLHLRPVDAGRRRAAGDRSVRRPRRLQPGPHRSDPGAAVARPAAACRATASARWPTSPTAARFRTAPGPCSTASTLVVIDALRHRPHPTHFTVAEALAAVQRLRPVARVVHAHLPRPAACRHHRQPARGRHGGDR